MVNFDGAPAREDPRDLTPNFNLAKWTYMSIESAPSIRLPTKYCDFTGYHALYRHKTAGNTGVGLSGQGVRYLELKQYEALEKMQNNKIEDILS